MDGPIRARSDPCLQFYQQNIPAGSFYIRLTANWEFITGDYYTGSGVVTWLVVAKDHYGGLDPHVTLLTEELICKNPIESL